MAPIGETFSHKVGPLPVGAWAALGTGGLALFLIKRKSSQNQQAAQAQYGSQGVSSNLGAVPLSNLTTAAEPMPIQMGDTFINIKEPDITTTVNEPPEPSFGPCPPGYRLNPAILSNLLRRFGFNPPQCIPIPLPTGGAPCPQGLQRRPDGTCPPPFSQMPPPPPTPWKAPPPAQPLPPAPPPPPAPQTLPPLAMQTVCRWPSWCGSLWGIAQHYYGGGQYWPQIYEANRGLIGANPNRIFAGQNLTIPFPAAGPVHDYLVARAQGR